MKKFYLWFIRVLAVLLALGVLALDGFFMPIVIYNLIHSNYELRLYLMFVIITIYLLSMALLIIFFNSILFMNIIDNHEVYTLKALKNLQIIRIFAFISTLIMSIGSVFLYFVVDYEDELGILLGWLVVLGVTFVIGVIVSLIRLFILEELKFDERK